MLETVARHGAAEEVAALVGRLPYREPFASVDMHERVPDFSVLPEVVQRDFLMRYAELLRNGMLDTDG